MVLSHRGLLRRGGRGGWGRARPASCAWAGWWAPWACVAYGPRVGLSTPRARSTRGTLGKEDARLQSEDAPTRMRAPRVYECHERVDGERARHPVFRHLRHGASAVLVAFRLGRERMDAQWRLRVTRVRRQLRAHKRKHPSTSHLVCELPCELPLSTDAVTLKP